MQKSSDFSMPWGLMVVPSLPNSVCSFLPTHYNTLSLRWPLVHRRLEWRSLVCNLKTRYNHLLVQGFIVHSFMFYIDDMSFAKNDGFISSFPMCILLFSFFCFIALASTSSRILKRSGERGYSCLVPEPMENLQASCHQVRCQL